MKISITGHTRGFGKYLFDTLAVDHSVIGFSKSTGFDISVKEDRASIIEKSSDCDVFINNAAPGFFQTELLYDIFKTWGEQPRMIINIGSNAKDYINVGRSFSYAVQKKALNEASKQLGRANKCKVIVIDFGFLDRDTQSPIGYINAFYYVNIALESMTKDHRLLEILVAHNDLITL